VNFACAIFFFLNPFLFHEKDFFIFRVLEMITQEPFVDESNSKKKIMYLYHSCPKLYVSQIKRRIWLSGMYS